MISHFKPSDTPAKPSSDEWALKLKATGKYLDSNIDPYMTSRDLVKPADVSAGAVLVMIESPAVQAKKVMQDLYGADRKKVLFHLQHVLSDASVAEEFLMEGGLSVLFQSVQECEGNTQAYALKSLRKALEYEDAMKTLLDKPQLVELLFDVVERPSAVVAGKREAVQALFEITIGVHHGDKAFDLVHDAAKRSAAGQKKKPYETIISLLDSADYDTKVNVLTLLNGLVSSCPSQERLSNLLMKWDFVGINRILQKQAAVEGTEFRTQLTLYEMASGVRFRKDSVVGGPNAPVGSSTKSAQGPMPYAEMEAKLKEYEAQQPLVLLLKEELRRAQEVIRRAQEQGLLINARAPLRRFPSNYTSRNATYATGQAVPRRAPVDLSFLKAKYAPGSRLKQIKASGGGGDYASAQYKLVDESNSERRGSKGRKANGGGSGRRPGSGPGGSGRKGAPRSSGGSGRRKGGSARKPGASPNKRQ